MADLIDDAFYIEKKSWGTFMSFRPDGSPLVTSLTRELCSAATRFYLKGLQDGFPAPDSSYTGVVGGKL
jgi:hypothetical protein